MIFFVISCIYLPGYLDTASPEFHNRKEYIQLVFQLVGGLIILLGLYMTYWRISVSESGVEVDRERQITERFTRGIEQLGSKRIEIRLGGIYALERIAKDSDKDHWHIIEVLTGFVRENSKWNILKEDEYDKYSDPKIDIQTAITVLGRRRFSYNKGESNRLDLRGADLRGVSFEDSDFKGAYFENVNLKATRLRNVNLEDASFSGWLHQTKFQDSNLCEASFYGELVNVSFISCDLRAVDFSQCEFKRVRFRRSKKKPIDLSDCNFAGVDLSQMDLSGANLSYADFTDAILNGTNLKGANLSSAIGITQEELDSAVIDSNTILPTIVQFDE
jgi:uncharacterized protein YjbI with pentapeptide repeats